MTIYSTLGLNGNYAGVYKRATILSIRPDQEKVMSAEQLKAFKTLPASVLADKTYRRIMHLPSSYRMEVFEFPNQRQLLVIASPIFYPFHYVLWAQPPVPTVTIANDFHGLGCWKVRKKDYLKVFGS